MTIDLRPLTLDDIPAIEQVERRAMPTPWSRSMFAGELAKSSSHCVGAFHREQDCLIGYIIVSRYVDAWHIMNIAVDEPYRRHGIATMLMRDLLDATDGDGLRGYTLEVRVSNLPAIRLYRSLGFSMSGVRRGYYTDNREDAYVMWRGPAGESDAAGGERP